MSVKMALEPQFFKTLFQSQFLFDFEEIFTNRIEHVRSFLGAQILNVHDLNTNLNYLSSNVLSLYCIIFDYIFHVKPHKSTLVRF
jgi:hypothetical protein